MQATTVLGLVQFSAAETAEKWPSLTSRGTAVQSGVSRQEQRRGQGEKGWHNRMGTKRLGSYGDKTENDSSEQLASNTLLHSLTTGGPALHTSERKKILAARRDKVGSHGPRSSTLAEEHHASCE